MGIPACIKNLWLTAVAVFVTVGVGVGGVTVPGVLVAGTVVNVGVEVITLVWVGVGVGVFGVPAAGSHVGQTGHVDCVVASISSTFVCSPPSSNTMQPESRIKQKMTSRIFFIDYLQMILLDRCNIYANIILECSATPDGHPECF